MLGDIAPQSEFVEIPTDDEAIRQNKYRNNAKNKQNDAGLCAEHNIQKINFWVGSFTCVKWFKQYET